MSGEYLPELACAAPDGPLTPVPSVEALPSGPGAYLLVLHLDVELPPDARRGQAALAPGRYLYLGSARGPGGLRARIRRHLRADKRPHWHVDRLTAAARVAAVLAWPEGGECRWCAAIRARGAEVPLPGFGSSDCRRCPAHLLRLEVTDAADPRLRPPADP